MAANAATADTAAADDTAAKADNATAEDAAAIDATAPPIMPQATSPPSLLPRRPSAGVLLLG